MTLENALIGRTYIVESIDLGRVTARRMEALGLTRGTVIKLLNKSRNGSIIIKVRGSRLALGKEIAASIQIREANV